MFIVIIYRYHTFLLYIFSYNEKYTSCIIRNTISCIMKCLLSLYIVSYNQKYNFMYQENICCKYTFSYIITTNIFIIHNLV